MDQGGYYPTAWGWTSLAALATALTALVWRRRWKPPPLAVVLVGALSGLLALVAVSTLRKGTATVAAPELQRGLAYLSVLVATIVVLRADDLAAMLAGTLAGTVLVELIGLHGLLLAAPAVPNPEEGRLLFEPIGYANAAGALAAMATVATYALAANARSPTGRALAAAASVPLVAALVATQSRGAVAALLLASGCVLLLEPDRRRVLRLLARMLPPQLVAASLVAASRVTDSHARLDVVRHDGRIVTAGLIVLAVAAPVAVCRFGPGSHRPRRGPAHGVRGAQLLALGGVLTMAALPATQLAGMQRAAFWSVAWHDFLSHRWLGSGAGTFGRVWLEHRTVTIPALDAHGLFAEAGAELGLPGLLLTVLFVSVPLLALGRACRSTPYGPYVAGVYIVGIAHSTVDWDWEMPVVTTTVVMAGAALVVAAARDDAGRSRGARTATFLMASTLAAGAAFFLAGEEALRAATDGARQGDWPTAQRFSERASRLQPWSATPLVVEAQAELAERQPTRARTLLLRALRLDPGDWRTWFAYGSLTDGRARATAAARIRRLDPSVMRRAGPGRSSFPDGRPTAR